MLLQWRGLDLGKLQPYLDRLLEIIAPARESLQSLDNITLAGLAASGIALMIGIRWLRKVLRGSDRSGKSAIRKDANRARKQGNYARAGELFEMAGDMDAAIKTYREGKAYNPLANLHEHRKEWTLAAAAYESARMMDKASLMYQRAGNHVKAAELLVTANKTGMAAEMYEKARVFSEAAPLYEKSGSPLKAAKCYEQSQNYLKAADLYEKHYLQESALLTGSFNSPDQKKVIQAYAQQSGRLYSKAGEPEKAAKIYSMGGYLGNAAEAYVAVKDFKKAADLYFEGKLYHKAAELYKKTGNMKKAYETAAEMYLDERNYLEAGKMFEKSGDHLQAGDLYERSGQTKKAGEMFMKGGDFVRANEIFQASGDPLLAAQALEKTKNFKEAAELYIKAGVYEVAARLLNESGDYYEAGMIFHRMGRLEDTISFLQKVDPGSTNYYSASLVLAQIFMDRGMLEAARERYKKLIIKTELGPDTIEPYFNLAVIYEMNREYDNALLLFDKVLAENYNYKDIQNHIELVKEGILRVKATAGQSSGSGKPSGRYKLISKVGQGGMGVVYRAEDTVLNRMVAYKVLPPSVRDNPKVLENFVQEARVAAAINHPNIVTIYDTGSEGVEPYIVMEFIDGTTVKEMLEEKSPLSIKDQLDISKQMCQGLEFAHSKNVIHRDIKPANVMLNKEGMVKIMDFGLAKILSSAALEGTGIQGTPLYMSPEQIEGKRVDHRTDLYSFGCTIYRMATGRPPFTDGDVYHHHMHTPPVPPKSLQPELPESMNRIILKCLAKKVDNRYQRAKEILADLEAVK